MTVLNDDRARQVVPRWRPSNWGDSRAALAVHGKTRDLGERPGEFQDALDGWRENNSVVHASELIGSALVLGRTSEAEVQAAAQYLLKHGNELNEALRSLASEAIGHSSLPEAQTAPVALRRLRSRLVQDPRDALGWIDFAFWQTTMGNTDAALRGVLAALANSNHRFVLRSAARFFLHIDDPERALRTLERGNTTDPWIVAAQVAIAGAANLQPPSIRRATQMIASGNAPAETSELAAAVATLELSTGDIRKAKGLATQALVNPTENAVAQVAWMHRVDRRVPLSLASFGHLAPSEAISRIALGGGDFKLALESAWKWHNDQPFSRQAPVAGSFAAAMGNEDHKSALEILEEGIRSNPRDPLLGNNKAFSLASIGQLDAAEAALRQARRPEDLTTFAISVATQGLIAYRRGQHDVGFKYYTWACDQLVEKTDAYARACLMHARESLQAGASWAPVVFKNAEKAATRSSAVDVSLWLERLQTKYKVQK